MHLRIEIFFWEVFDMSLIGNIIWLFLGGIFSGLMWLIAGLLWCMTIIGIPYGTQCFKFASLSFCPFGKEVIYGGGPVSLLANIIWLLFFGIEMAAANAAIGLLLCLTIVGIPFGKQFFKIAKLALMPFGARII